MPPELAQAPIVARSFAWARSSTISRAWSGVETEPSTIRRSNGPVERSLVASGNSTKWTSPASGMQLVLEVEDRQLAAVAGGVLDDADAEPGRCCDRRGSRTCRALGPVEGSARLRSRARARSEHLVARVEARRRLEAEQRFALRVSGTRTGTS